jgi:hypothetical protein
MVKAHQARGPIVAARTTLRDRTMQTSFAIGAVGRLHEET